MTSRFALGVILSALTCVAPAAAQQKLKSFIPANAKPVTINSGYGCEQAYMVSVIFRKYGGAELAQAAQTAWSKYAYPGATLLRDSDGDPYIRVIDVRDVPGMLGYLKKYSRINGMRVAYIPFDKRYASIDDQLDASDDSPADYFVELGGKPCKPKR